METKFTVDFFIKKFEAIPEEKWGVRQFSYKDKRCALGFCGAISEGSSVTLTHFPEAHALYLLIKNALGEVVFHVNDGVNTKYIQRSPKQRILAALYDIKKLSKGQEVQECDATKPIVAQSAGQIKVIHHYVSVSETIKEETKDLILN